MCDCEGVRDDRRADIKQVKTKTLWESMEQKIPMFEFLRFILNAQAMYFNVSPTIILG